MIRHKLISPILLWTIAIGGIIIIFNVVADQKVFASNTFSSILVISAGLYWLYFLCRAVYIHRQVVLSADKITKLVSQGVYGLVRHPIYAADLVLAWAIFLFWPERRVLISVLWLTLVLIFWMKLEERALTEKFGDEYREYQKRAPMIFPRIFKK